MDKAAIRVKAETVVQLPCFNTLYEYQEQYMDAIRQIEVSITQAHNKAVEACICPKCNCGGGESYGCSACGMTGTIGVQAIHRLRIEEEEE